MLGGQGLEIFRGTYKRWAESYGKNGDNRTVNKKDIPEKPQGGCINPPPLCRRWLSKCGASIINIISSVNSSKSLKFSLSLALHLTFFHICQSFTDHVLNSNLMFNV